MVRIFPCGKYGTMREQCQWTYPIAKQRTFPTPSAVVHRDRIIFGVGLFGIHHAHGPRLSSSLGDTSSYEESLTEFAVPSS